MNCNYMQHILALMYPIFLCLTDVNTNSNLCDVFIPLQLYFVKLDSLLRDCTSHDD